MYNVKRSDHNKEVAAFINGDHYIDRFHRIDLIQVTSGQSIIFSGYKLCFTSGKRVVGSTAIFEMRAINSGSYILSASTVVVK